MIDYDEISRACRLNDAEAIGGDFEEILDAYGVDAKGAMNAARQRALRMYMIDHGMPLPRANEPVTVPVSPEDLVPLAGTWLDGLITGMRLSRITPDSNNRTVKI